MNTLPVLVSSGLLEETKTFHRALVGSPCSDSNDGKGDLCAKLDFCLLTGAQITLYPWRATGFDESLVLWEWQGQAREAG